MEENQLIQGIREETQEAIILSIMQSVAYRDATLRQKNWPDGERFALGLENFDSDLMKRFFRLGGSKEFNALLEAGCRLDDGFGNISDAMGYNRASGIVYIALDAGLERGDASCIMMLGKIYLAIGHPYDGREVFNDAQFDADLQLDAEREEDEQWTQHDKERIGQLYEAVCRVR